MWPPLTSRTAFKFFRRDCRRAYKLLRSAALPAHLTEIPQIVIVVPVGLPRPNGQAKVSTTDRFEGTRERQGFRELRSMHESTTILSLGLPGWIKNAL
jgi:hypothetical protein